MESHINTEVLPFNASAYHQGKFARSRPLSIAQYVVAHPGGVCPAK